MQNDYWKKIGVPFVKSPPLVGIFWDIIFKKKGFRETIVNIYKQYEGNKFVGYYQLLSPTIMIRDPELINQVLIKDFTHFEDRGPQMKGAKNLLSLGLSILSGDEWRNARHKITPTFTSGKLKMMFGPIKECSDEVIHHIDSKPGEDIEVRDLMLRYILNVIGNVAFGIKLDILNEKDKQSQEFMKYSSLLFKPSVLVLLKVMITMAKPKIGELLKFRLMDKDLETFFRQLTHDAIKCRENNSTRRNDFLQLMLDLQKKELNSGLRPGTSDRESEPIDTEDKELMDQLKNTPQGNNEKLKSETFSEEFIASQALLFISGGSETTATILSLVLYEMAVNPDLQKKVQVEIGNVLNSQEFNYQAIRKLTYMEQFINETLRVHPLAVVLPRYCTRDYKIPGTEVVIPKGTFVNIPAGGLHKDPQYFPDPDKFNPDRFEDMDAIPKGAFFPFGGGPRICIAMRLAMLEMKISLASLLTNFTVVLSEKTKLPLKEMKKSSLLQLDGGVWLKFNRRNA